MKRRRAAPHRGFTLVEVTLVIALAGFLTAALAGFYLSSQAAWTDGSTQALTQRDGTFLVSVISDSTRCARRAVVLDIPDPRHVTLYLYASPGDVASRCFYWRDSLVYMGGGAPDPLRDQPLVSSRVSRFALSTNGNSLVLLDLVELPCPGVEPLRLASAAALYNR